MVQALLHPRFVPDLHGYKAIQQLSIERTGIEAEREPRHHTRRSDQVWELARGRERRLLLLEYQAKVDPGMGIRMAEYMVNLWHSAGRQSNVPIYPLLLSTAARPFGPWLQPWPHPAGDRSVYFVDGPLLDIHQYPFPSRDPTVFDLPRDNLMTSVIALARLQWALRTRSRDPVTHSVAYDLLLHVVVDWLKPLLDPAGSELGNSLAVWIATGMKDFLRSWPASGAALDNISTLTFAQLEKTMTTVQDLVREVRQEGLQAGHQEGLQEGLLTILTDYVRLGWDDAAAAAFRLRLADVPPEQMPSLADLQNRLQRREPPLPQANGVRQRSAE